MLGEGLEFEAEGAGAYDVDAVAWGDVLKFNFAAVLCH